MKKLTISLTLILMLLSGCAQNKPVASFSASFSAVIVTDFERSMDWYTKVLGFNVLNKMVSDERGFKQANLRRDDVMLELLELKRAVSSKAVLSNHSKKAKMTGFFKVGFIVTDFEQWIEKFKQHNVEFNGRVVKDSLSGKKMVVIFDPDGNRVQIFEL